MLMQRSVVGRTTGLGWALEIAWVPYPLVSVSPLCRRNVSRKWETCHIPYVRFTRTRHTRHRPMNGQLLAELTALPLATHVTGMGCVQHPGRRENRRRRTPAQGVPPIGPTVGGAETCAVAPVSRRHPGRPRRLHDLSTSTVDPSNNGHRIDRGRNSGHPLRPGDGQCRGPSSRWSRAATRSSGAEPLCRRCK